VADDHQAAPHHSAGLLERKLERHTGIPFPQLPGAAWEAADLLPPADRQAEYDRLEAKYGPRNSSTNGTGGGAHHPSGRARRRIMTTTTRPPRIATVGGRERRFFTKLEARDDGGLQFVVSGYASVTDRPYDMGGHSEVISRGAFAKSIADRADVQLLVNHEGLPLARTTVPASQPGHLSLSEDHKGLHFQAQLDRNDVDAQVLMRRISSGLMDQASFAFKVVRQDWSSDYTQRTIQEVSLDRGDVSIVNYGASPTTSVDARSRHGRGGNLSLYRARARALALGDARTRHLIIINEAGRRIGGLHEARALALELKGRRRG